MAMSPALMGSASAATPMTSQLSSGAPNGGGAESGDMGALMGQIRQVAQSVDALGASNPALASGVTQIKTILRQMIMQAAQAASVQTPSGEALPGGGM